MLRSNKQRYQSGIPTSDLNIVTQWCFMWTQKSVVSPTSIKNNQVSDVKVYSLPDIDSKQVEIRHTKEEPELGIIVITHDFKFSVQADHAASKPNRILGMLRST